MVGEQQAVVALGIETRVADRSGDRAQVRRIGVVVLDDLDGVAEPREPDGRGDLIPHRTGGRVRALRIQGQNHDAIASAFAERADRLPHPRLAEAHSDAHGNVETARRELLAHASRERIVRNRRGRAFVGPDQSILFSRCLTPFGEDEQMEDPPPHDAVHGRDTAVHEETRQKRPDRARSRRGGSARVDEQHARFRRSRHHPPPIDDTARPINESPNETAGERPYPEAPAQCIPCRVLGGNRCEKFTRSP